MDRHPDLIAAVRRRHCVDIALCHKSYPGTVRRPGRGVRLGNRGGQVHQVVPLRVHREDLEITVAIRHECEALLRGSERRQVRCPGSFGRPFVHRFPGIHLDAPLTQCRHLFVP